MASTFLERDARPRYAGTAFALPAQFPGRDLIVVCAFCVVLGTLVIQGLTLRPLLRLLR
jgi:monovalent cation/hydrogen antiporter